MLITPEELLYQYMSQNTAKRYYLKHSNIFTAYFGVCNDDLSKQLIAKIMSDEINEFCQPYFMYYLFGAIFRLGLRDKYTVELVNRWKPYIKECDKGLTEGFYKHELGYAFDHSHAWGGTPLWSLPKALLGMGILKSGMKEIKLSLSLFGLKKQKLNCRCRLVR